MPLTYRFHRHDSLGSTNDEAKRLAALGAPEGTLVTAETQTAGRGRSGRAWVTPHGAAIALSVVLRPDLRSAAHHLAHVALLGGLAAAEGIEQAAALPARLKWPNDVLVRGKKVAGVLAEASFAGEPLGVEYVVLGIGVNVNAGPPPDLRLEYETTWLARELGQTQPLDREAVVRAILDALDRRYPQLGTPALAAAWSERLAMRGEPVRIVGLADTVSGILEGVNEDGSLVLRMADGGTRTILAGDVHLRSA